MANNSDSKSDGVSFINTRPVSKLIDQRTIYDNSTNIGTKYQQTNNKELIIQANNSISEPMIVRVIQQQTRTRTIN
jgi:hypothetical protein